MHDVLQLDRKPRPVAPSSQLSNVPSCHAALMGLHRALLVRCLRYLVRCPYIKVPSVEASTSQEVETMKVA